MKQVVGATLKSSKGICEIAVHLVNKDYMIKFKKDENGDAIVYVPKVLTYKDDFGKTIVAIENLPQFLLDKYSYIELVSVKEEDEIKKDVIVDKKKKPVDDYQKNIKEKVK